MGESTAQCPRSLLKCDPSVLTLHRWCWWLWILWISNVPIQVDNTEIPETGNVTLGLEGCLISLQAPSNKLPLMAASPGMGLPPFFVSLWGVLLIFLWIFIIQGLFCSSQSHARVSACREEELSWDKNSSPGGFNIIYFKVRSWCDLSSSRMLFTGSPQMLFEPTNPTFPAINSLGGCNPFVPLTRTGINTQDHLSGKE